MKKYNTNSYNFCLTSLIFSGLTYGQMSSFYIYIYRSTFPRTHLPDYVHVLWGQYILLFDAGTQVQIGIIKIKYIFSLAAGRKPDENDESEPAACVQSWSENVSLKLLSSH